MSDKLQGFQQARMSSTYTAINPVELPQIAFDELSSKRRDGIFVEPPGTTRVFSRYSPVFFDDPDGVGLFNGNIDIAQYFYPPVFTAAVSHARLVGYRTILTPGKPLLHG